MLWWLTVIGTTVGVALILASVAIQIYEDRTNW